jgi:hypothetical protein
MANGDNTIIDINLGIDIGYHTSKIVFESDGENKEIDFLSTVKQNLGNESNILSGTNKKVTNIIYDGSNYTIGSISGEPTEDLNKLNDNDFKLFLITSIIKCIPINSDEINVNFVTGLPSTYYDKQKNKLRNMFENTKHEVSVLVGEKYVNKVINIKNVRAFPQCTGLFILYPVLLEEGKYIVIDWGGKTLDVICYENGEIVSQRTFPIGALDLYKDIQEELESNPEYSVECKKMSCETVIRKRSIIIEGAARAIPDFINAQLETFANKGLKILEDNVPDYKTSNRIFIGGTSSMVKEYLPKESKLISDIYFNARIFHQIAISKFKRG